MTQTLLCFAVTFWIVSRLEPSKATRRSIMLRTSGRSSATVVLKMPMPESRAIASASLHSIIRAYSGDTKIASRCPSSWRWISTALMPIWRMFRRKWSRASR